MATGHPQGQPQQRSALAAIQPQGPNSFQSATSFSFFKVPPLPATNIAAFNGAPLNNGSAINASSASFPAVGAASFPAIGMPPTDNISYIGMPPADAPLAHCAS